MNAIDLLKDHHDEIATLFECIDEASDGGDEQRALRDLAKFIVAHDGMEREVLFRRCVDRLGRVDALVEAEVHHGVIEFALFGALSANDREDFDARCKILRDLVASHIEAVEGDILPLMEERLGPPELEQLGSDLEQHFNEALDHDVNKALTENLAAVLTGVVPSRRASLYPAPPRTTPSSVGSR